jgi:AcrR family transcriptional regulator
MACMRHRKRTTRTVGATASKGARTRTSILERAANLATAKGLDQLSLGELADELGMSKSGIFAHFGSKEQLQLETIDHALSVFVERVVQPARLAPEGLTRFWTLCERWLTYCESEVFSGGCFFAAASVEFENRPGTVRDRITALVARQFLLLETELREAMPEGESTAYDEPIRQIAFEISVAINGANWHYQLFRDPSVFRRARTALAHALDRLSSRACRSENDRAVLQHP